MNLEKFKELSLKKKIEWVVHYYGIAIVVAIIAICVAANFLYSVFCPKPLSDICVLILSDDYTGDEIPFLEEEINAITGSSASVEIYNVSDVYGSGAFSIKLNSDQVDIVISPKEQTDLMLESSYLEKYEQIWDKDLYLGIPFKARKSENLDKTAEFFMTYKK